MLSKFVAFLLLGTATIAPQRGQSVAQINFSDESGRTRNLAELAGYPVVLLPMYTRCPSACLLTVAQLKRALSNSNTDPTQFRVLLFSFDPNETPATLAPYREREAIPLSWIIGRSDQSDIDALLESIGFQSAKAGTEFMHPNLVVFLDAKLRVAKWIYGTDYSAADLDAGLQIASGRSDWIGQHFDVVYALLVFAAAALCVALVQEMSAKIALTRRPETPPV
jgi:protein SCO1/2